MNKYKAFKRVEKLMGNQFEICVVAKSEVAANEQMTESIKEIKRIEKKFTTFSDDSLTNRINAQAGIAPVKVDLEFFQLVARAQKISKLTRGAFDLSYGSLDKSLWNFDTTMTQLPRPSALRESVSLIDYKNIELDKKELTVFLKRKGMRIGFGGIGKGYAADMAKKRLQRMGVPSGFVNASGDLVTWGKQVNGKGWNIGVCLPDTSNQFLGQLEVNNAAIATSGDYEKYIEIDGQRFSHTIDPTTGYPVQGMKSVSIITRNAELADAMATPITILGVLRGLELVNQIHEMECILIDNKDNLYLSNGLKTN